MQGRVPVYVAEVSQVVIVVARRGESAPLRVPDFETIIYSDVDAR